MTANKTQLHAILAVETAKKSLATQMVEEGIKTFTQKQEHFKGHVIEFIPSDENEIAPAPSVVEITETVPDKLDYVLEYVGNHIDLILEKDAANQKAISNLIVDGQTLATGLPATFLLAMESEFKKIRALIASVPTLPPATKWEKDESHEKQGVFKQSNVEEKYRTKKINKPIVMYEATANHPAQVKEGQEDINVGIVRTSNWNSSISSARKSALLKKVDKLIDAFKVARQNANCVEIEQKEIAKSLFGYIFEE